MKITDAQFKARLVAKYDEGLATCRDLIARSGECNSTIFLRGLIRAMHLAAGEGHADIATVNAFAVLGFLEAWIALLEQREAEAEA